MSPDPTPAPATGHLTPTEDLVMEVLAARHRLGEQLWTFDARHRRVIESLAEKGLANLIHGTVERTVRASLTAAGRDRYLKADYVAPVLAPGCRSFYFGPKTSEFRVDCTRRNHHRGKHRAPWMRLKKKTGASVRVVVEWTDEQAGGLHSARYPGLRDSQALGD